MTCINDMPISQYRALVEKLNTEVFRHPGVSVCDLLTVRELGRRLRIKQMGVIQVVEDSECVALNIGCQTSGGMHVNDKIGDHAVEWISE